MAYQDVDPRICRICEGKKFLVNLLEDANIHLLGKLREIQDPNVKKKDEVENFDELFQYICRSCENALEGFYVFKNRVQKMHRKLMFAALTGRINVSACDDQEPEEFPEPPPLHVFGQNPRNFIEESSDHEENHDPLDVGFSQEETLDEIKKSGIIKTEPEFIMLDAKYLLEYEDDEDKDVTYKPTEETSSSDEIDSMPIQKRKKLSRKKEQINERSIPPAKSRVISYAKSPDKKIKTPEKQSTFAFRKCPICRRKFSLEENFQNHIKLHSNLTFKCFACKRAYSSKLNCEIHELSHKTGQPGVKERLKELRARRTKALLLCLKNREEADEMSRNFAVRSPSSGIPNVRKECKLCGKMFRNLNLHLKTHLQKNLSCIFCFEKFSSKGILRFHMRRNHPLLIFGKK